MTQIHKPKANEASGKVRVLPANSIARAAMIFLNQIPENELPSFVYTASDDDHDLFCALTDADVAPWIIRRVNQFNSCPPHFSPNQKIIVPMFDSDPLPVGWETYTGRPLNGYRYLMIIRASEAEKWANDHITFIGAENLNRLLPDLLSLSEARMIGDGLTT